MTIENAQTVLHYAPRTRSITALWLLEELGIDYQLESFDINAGRHKQPDFIAMNAMGKVPVVVDNDLAVSELGAIAIYLSDRYGESELAPAIDHPDRAAYLRWCFFASAIMEPTFGEKFFKWNLPASSVAWGSFDHMLETLEKALADGPWILGETFSAADVLVGSNARFGKMFGAIQSEVVDAYIDRISARPAFVRAAEIEQREGERFPLPQ